MNQETGRHFRSGVITTFTGPQDDEPRACSCLACNVCEKPFETYVLTVAGRDLCPVKTCETCSISARVKEQEEAREKLKAKREQRFNKLCPDTYRAEAIRKAMMEQKESQAKAVREAVQAGRGVIAIGESGQFKTTTMFNAAVKWLILEGHEVEYLTAAKFRQRASHHAKECTVEAFVRSLARIPWLFLDDFGNMNTTQAASEAILALFEERMNRGNRPFLVTSQFGGSELIAKFANRQLGEAIVRRLSMLATPVQF
jgi:DNA replication protein DnaC